VDVANAGRDVRPGHRWTERADLSQLWSGRGRVDPSTTSRAGCRNTPEAGLPSYAANNYRTAAPPDGCRLSLIVVGGGRHWAANTSWGLQ
jgi:hypothetical protein